LPEGTAASDRIRPGERIARPEVQINR
jgi:hypothetical protein